MSILRLAAATVAAIWRHPHLWVEGAKMAVETRRRGRPWPSRAYVAWRVHTAEGGDGAVPSPRELARFVEWRRRARSLR